MRLWERIREDSRDFGRGFVSLWETIVGICKTLGEDLCDFGRGFTRIHETLEEYLQGFLRLWERIRTILGEDS